MPEEYYSHGQSVWQHSVHRHCEFAIGRFYRKWYPHAKRKEYLATFSTLAWKNLPPGKQSEHSLSNCHACAEKYGELQQAFLVCLAIVPLPDWFMFLPTKMASQCETWLERFLGNLTDHIRKCMAKTFLMQLLNTVAGQKALRGNQSKKRRKQLARFRESAEIPLMSSVTPQQPCHSCHRRMSHWQATNRNDWCSHLITYKIVGQRRVSFPPKRSTHGTQLQLWRKFRSGQKTSIWTGLKLPGVTMCLVGMVAR